jgi:exonuclease SbcD
LLRLLHLADIHLGVETFGRIDPATGLNTRLLDFTARLDEAIDHALSTNVDLVLFAGDAYRSRDPSATQQREFAKRVRRLSEANVPTFLLVGNHDLPAATGRANSLDIYETLGVPHVTIGRLPGIHTIQTKAGPLQIVALPWLRRSALLARDEYRNASSTDVRKAIEALAADFIADAASKLDPNVPAVLAAHVSVEGATYGSERSVLVGEDIVLPRSTVANPAFSYVALGHIHKHQVLYDEPLTLYPGSLERVDFGEERDAKGFVTVEIDGKSAKHTFHPVNARRFVTIRSRPSSALPTEEILRDVERAEPAGAIARLIVEAEPDVDARIDYGLVRRALRESYAVAGIRREVARPDRRQSGVSGVESLSESEALDLYLKHKEVPDERRKQLLEYAQRLGTT